MVELVQRTQQADEVAQAGPILLVDDEPYVLRWLTHLLTRAGYEVATAADGEAALSRARELHPSLIFLDLKLPRMDGCSVYDEIRRDPDLSGTHVVVLSASEWPEEGPWGWVCAPDAFLAKPIRPREIVEQARVVLGSPHGPAPAA
jgi:CheY-like chemotaxis protein